MSNDTAEMPSTPEPKRVASELTSASLFNTTPHAIVVVRTDGTQETIDKTSVQLRLSEAPAQTLDVPGDYAVIAPPVYTGLEGDVTAVPPGSCIVVSAVVGEFLRNNGLPLELAGCTVVGPATGPANAVRSPSGALIGTNALVKYL